MVTFSYKTHFSMHNLVHSVPLATSNLIHTNVLAMSGTRYRRINSDVNQKYFFSKKNSALYSRILEVVELTVSGTLSSPYIYYESYNHRLIL